jgi:hypothetical protein
MRRLLIFTFLILATTTFSQGADPCGTALIAQTAIRAAI